MSGWDEVVNNEAPQQAALEQASGATESASSRFTGVSLTLKADGAYDAPWYVIHGDTATDVLDQLKDPKLMELLQLVTTQSVGWSKHQSSAKGLTTVANDRPAQQQGQRQQSQRNNAPAEAAPNEPAPSCEHGPREWKAFTSSKGNYVKGWFCTVQGSDCKPLYRK